MTIRSEISLIYPLPRVLGYKRRIAHPHLFVHATSERFLLALVVSSGSHYHQIEDKSGPCTLVGHARILWACSE